MHIWRHAPQPDSLCVLLPIQPADLQDLVLQHVEVVGGLLSAFPAEQPDWIVSLCVGHQLLVAEVQKETSPAPSGACAKRTSHARLSSEVEMHQA